MIEVFNHDLKSLGVLENAKAGVNLAVNQVWEATITLPGNDPKNKLCTHFNFISVTSPSGRYYGLYRIMPKETSKNENTNTITYTCEHVLATLMDDVIEGYHVFSGKNTEEVLQGILDLQTTKHWELGNVEIDLSINYTFEDERTLLAPIFEVPKTYAGEYEFITDTSVYPWKLHLIEPSNKVVQELRWGKNLGSFDDYVDPTGIINRLYPKGYGEGVNRLDISKVNNGKKYIEDTNSIERWGLHQDIWIDTRFENAKALLSRGQAILEKSKDPKIAITCKGYDLSVLPENNDEELKLNGMTRIIVEDDDYYGRLVELDIPDISKEWDVDVDIQNKLGGIAENQTDLERRLEVNSSYSRGATVPMTFSYQDNADSNVPAVIPFYIDDDIINVNTCELTFRTKPFRAYSRATEGGGAVVKSTSSGGGRTVTSSSGGGTTATSSSGGGTSRSTSSGGGVVKSSGQSTGYDQNILPLFTQKAFGSVYEDHYHFFNLNMNDWNHYHQIDVPAHTHDFTVPNHTHSVQIPNHTHTITLTPHTHEIELPNHTHNVKHEINELNTLPTSVTIKVDGNLVPHTSINGDRINLVDYMSKDSDGRVTRGRHEVEITPNGLGRIEADVILRVFIQAHIGGVF